MKNSILLENLKIMSNSETSRKRQVLILVEGKHEKETLLKMLLLIYPKIPIRRENIHIYETDIYDLYYRIENEYGTDWDAPELEIDIPKLISIRNGITPPLEGRKFTDIFLMFDFERHDNWYSDEKITRLQKYFSSTREHGCLYINYPMIEAYQHMAAIPDPDYLTKSVPVFFGQNANYGDKYKALAKDDSCIIKYLDLYEKCLKSIVRKMPHEQTDVCESILYQILSLSNNGSLLADIDSILSGKHFAPDAIKELKFYLRAQIKYMRYTDEGKNYWEKMQEIFFSVINQNIEKSWYIQNGMNGALGKSLHDAYFEMNWNKVLLEQINSSKDPINGKIWVLCSCITFIGDYKFYWRDQMPRA